MRMSYEATIGLEIHAELKTHTKMFCDSKNDPDETNPNVNVCPVCLAHPGTLPAINREAVKHVLRVGIALGGVLADYTEFDRKNYFYPDLPKGYQISQFAHPLISGGSLAGVAITRVHLEEDTASSIHDDTTGTTVIDFNRSGVPLMELVTEPVIKSAEEAGAFARELQLLLRYLNASGANMEKGEMRVEANISVARSGERGTKVEIKNLNSFRIMERAVAYEIERQTAALEKGERVAQETRGWDEKLQKTFPQRVKEGSADYRYFPDPDLPSLKLSLIPEYELVNLKKTMPELPKERRERYLALGIKLEDVELFVRDTVLGDFFEKVISSCTPGSNEVILASNYIANDLVKIIRDIQERDSSFQPEIPISVSNFMKIVRMISDNRISSRTAKDLLSISIGGGDPEEIAKERGLFKSNSDDELQAVVMRIIYENPKVTGDLQAGKIQALEYLVGQCMRAMRGAADPIVLREMIKKSLSK